MYEYCKILHPKDMCTREGKLLYKKSFFTLFAPMYKEAVLKVNKYVLNTNSSDTNPSKTLLVVKLKFSKRRENYGLTISTVVVKMMFPYIACHLYTNCEVTHLK